MLIFDGYHPRMELVVGASWNFNTHVPDRIGPPKRPKQHVDILMSELFPRYYPCPGSPSMHLAGFGTLVSR